MSIFEIFASAIMGLFSGSASASATIQNKFVEQQNSKVLVVNSSRDLSSVNLNLSDKNSAQKTNKNKIKKSKRGKAIARGSRLNPEEQAAIQTNSTSRSSNSRNFRRGSSMIPGQSTVQTNYTSRVRNSRRGLLTFEEKMSIQTNSTSHSNNSRRSS